MSVLYDTASDVNPTLINKYSGLQLNLVAARPVMEQTTTQVLHQNTEEHLPWRVTTFMDLQGFWVTTQQTMSISIQTSNLEFKTSSGSQ